MLRLPYQILIILVAIASMLLAGCQQNSPAVSVPTFAAGEIATMTTQQPTPQSETIIKPSCEPMNGKVQQACQSEQTGLHYLLYQPGPDLVAAGEKPPLVVFLHGFNLSGSDLSMVFNASLPAEIEGGRNLPMVVVSPQCPAGDNWQYNEMVERLSRFVDEMTTLYDTDPRRVILTGFSMGGDGVWAVGMAHPEQFSALVPVASWLNRPEDVCAVKDIAVWDFQSEQDEIVHPRYALGMVKALEHCGGNVKLTMFKEGGHSASSAMAYGTDEIYSWMMEQIKE